MYVIVLVYFEFLFLTSFLFLPIKGKRTPLKFLLPSNTRQWSSGYLVISRLLQLADVYNTVRSIPGLKIDLPEVDWNQVTNAQKVLFEMYYRIQVIIFNSREF
jgi:hypothetical protein